MAKIAAERLDHAQWAPPWTKFEHWARYEFANEFTTGRVVVDCACGDGTSTNIFSKRARKVFGFDASQTSIDNARKRYRDSNIVFQQANATSLSLDGSSTEVFISLETIEHLEDDRLFLDEVERVLHPGGVFICSTPDRDVYSPGNQMSDKPWNRYHIKEFNSHEFIQTLQERFQTVRVYGQNPTFPTLVKVKCALGQRFSRNLVLRMNQFFKLRFFVWRSHHRYRVVNASSNRKYEYIVAVCTGVLQKT